MCYGITDFDKIHLPQTIDQGKFGAEQIIITFDALQKSHSAFTCILSLPIDFFLKKNDSKAPQIRMIIQD